MRTLYIDGKAGISSDMMLAALQDLNGTQKADGWKNLDFLVHSIPHDERHHHRSYRRIEKAIQKAPIPLEAKEYAKRIYRAIGRVEARIHRCTLDDLHLHELGRRQAIHNILGIALFYHGLAVGKVRCSPLTVGWGKVNCSHGEMEVPVPAVRALMEESKLLFRTGSVAQELVTPSGLAILVGLEAQPGSYHEGKILGQGSGLGTKETGLGALKILLVEEEEITESLFKREKVEIQQKERNHAKKPGKNL
jgi:hypothetical protein